MTRKIGVSLIVLFLALSALTGLSVAQEPGNPAPTTELCDYTIDVKVIDTVPTHLQCKMPNYVRDTQDGNKYYIVYGGEDQKPTVVVFDYATKTFSSPIVIGPNPLWDNNHDEHGRPVIVMDGDGYLHVFYGCHNSCPIYHAISDQPHDASSWHFDNITVSGDGFSYPRPFRLPDGSIILFVRDKSKRLAYLLSSEDYSVSHVIVDLGGKWVYTHFPQHFYQVGDRIYFAFCYYVSGEMTRRNVYAAYLNTTNFHLYALDGTDLGTEITEDELDSVLVTTALTYRQVVYVREGVITILYDVKRNSGNYDYDLYYVQFDSAGNVLAQGLVDEYINTAFDVVDEGDKLVIVATKNITSPNIEYPIHYYPNLNGVLYLYEVYDNGSVYSQKLLDETTYGLIGSVPSILKTQNGYIVFAANYDPSMTPNERVYAIGVNESLETTTQTKRIVIQGSGTDLVVPVYLNASNFDFAATDGSDIRIYFENGTLAPYWVEVYDSENQRGVVWVKVPEAPINLTMKYGDGIVGEQHPDEIFVLFDDFVELNTTKWQVYGEGVESVNGVLHLDGTSSSSSYVIANDLSLSPGYAVIMRVKRLELLSWANMYAGFAEANGEPWYKPADSVFFYSFAQTDSVSYLTLATRVNAGTREEAYTNVSFADDVWYRIRVDWTTGAAKMSVNVTEDSVENSDVPSSNLSLVLFARGGSSDKIARMAVDYVALFVPNDATAMVVDPEIDQLNILEPGEGDWVAGTFTVTWEPYEGADHYTVLLDGSMLGSTTDTTYSVTATDGSHAVTVRAHDSSDNLIAEGSVDVNVDATAPTVSITSPSDGATLGPGTVTVTWDASDSGSGISTIKVYLDGGLEATLGPGNASYDLDLSVGDHTITVKVYDAVGNAGSDAVSVTVSGEISVTITSPSEGDYVATGDVTVTWTYSGTVDHFGVSVDGGSEQDVGTSTSVTLTLDDGQHTVTVTAHGSATASDSVTFTVDTTPPSLSVSAPAYATGDYEVAWTCAEDNLDHYEVSVDGGAWQNVGTSASYTVTDPTEGSHTVAVKAVDKAGNEATQTVTTVVDVTPPSLTITSPEDDSVIVGHSVTLEWSVSDSGSGIDYVGYRVGTGAWTEVTGATQVVLTLDDGYYTVTMKAVDNAGNEVYRAVSFTVVDPIQLTITSPEENATLEPGNITVTWEVNGTVDHFAVRLDDGPWIDVGNATSWTFANVTEGEHTVYVRAYENETAYVEESVSFTIASSGGTGGSWWGDWGADDVKAWFEEHSLWILALVVVVLVVLVGRRW